MNKTDVYHIDNIWSLNVIDLNDYGPENNRGYSYALVQIDNSVKLVRRYLSKTKMLKQVETLSKIFF